MIDTTQNDIPVAIIIMPETVLGASNVIIPIHNVIRKIGKIGTRISPPATDETMIIIDKTVAKLFGRINVSNPRIVNKHPKIKLAIADNLKMSFFIINLRFIFKIIKKTLVFLM